MNRRLIKIMKQIVLNSFRDALIYGLIPPTSAFDFYVILKKERRKEFIKKITNERY